MKADLKKIALERIYVLVKEAQANARKNPTLAQRQASLAKKLSTKYKIKLPYEIRMQFCKKCKSFIAPGVASKIRLGRSTLKSVRITCQFCHHTYHKVIPSPK
ncbi:MAG: RNase P subunit [Candidatus Nitrosotenuis sp.]